MNKHCIVALSLLAAGTAWAEGPLDYPPQQPWTSTLTRAEVLASMKEPEVQAQVKPRTRAEVIAELKAARDSGEAQAFIGEDSGAAYLALVQQAEGRSLLAGMRVLALQRR